MARGGLLNRCMDWFATRGRPGAPDEIYQSLQQWSHEPVAAQLLQEQQAQLDPLLAGLFGYHLVELSAFGSNGLCRESKINHCSSIGMADSQQASAIARFEQLPLSDESIDVVLLHHALDYSQHPHQVLREAARVLIPRGHIVVVGFNPYSWTGVFKAFKQFVSGHWCWRRNSLSSHRIKDWLHLLELDTVETYSGFFRPPFNGDELLSKMSFFEKIGRRFNLPFGGYYILLARKERIGVTPIKPLWNSFRGVRGISVPKPSVGMAEPSGRSKPAMVNSRRSDDRTDSN